MSVKVENLEHNMAKLTVEVDAAEFDKALVQVYNRQKKNISVPGFRKGKVPMNMVEKMYGPEIFYEDAANIVLQNEYPKAYDECGLEIVSQPDIEIVELGKGKNMIFTATVAVKPEVKLGKYKGVKVEKIEAEVTDEELEARLTAEQNKNSRVVTVEREIAEGDIANIDFEGFIDDVAFDGGKGEGYDLEIGSHSFIDTFEDQLVGKKAGDALDVNVTFPEEYQADELAGKPAVFKVVINEVKTRELPELDDEFAQDVSEFDTLDEYKEGLKKELLEQKEADIKRAMETEAIDAIIEKSEMDIPDAMIDAQVDATIREFAQNISMQGLSFEQYMQFTGMTMEKFKEQVRPDAVKKIQSSLVLEAIAKKENIEVSDEDVDKEIETMAASYGMPAEEIKKYMGEEETKNMKNDLAVSKAVDFVMENLK